MTARPEGGWSQGAYRKRSFVSLSLFSSSFDLDLVLLARSQLTTHLFSFSSLLLLALFLFQKKNRTVPVRITGHDGGSGGESTAKLSAENVRVLLVTSRSGAGLVFPKGGWETDESCEAAAARETVEEAGVRGGRRAWR